MYSQEVEDHSQLQTRDHLARLAKDSAKKSEDIVKSLDSEQDEYMGIITGIVKRFGDYGKPGFGYIKGSNNEEYFVHYSDILSNGFKNLAQGQHVRFKGFLGKRGLYAKEVKVF